MPCGRVIRMCIESTWGDKHYVGLSGIEVFDERGELVIIEDPSTQVCVFHVRLYAHFQRACRFFGERGELVVIEDPSTQVCVFHVHFCTPLCTF